MGSVLKSGNSVILCGSVGSSGISLRQTNTGRAVSNFSVKYGIEEAENGVKKGKYLNVTAWGRLAEQYAQYLEPGDSVVVIGELKQNTYNGKTTWFVDADFIQAQTYFESQEETEDNADDSYPPGDLPEEEYPEVLQ